MITITVWALILFSAAGTPTRQLDCRTSLRIISGVRPSALMV